MTWLFDFVFIVFIIFSLPVYLIRRKFHRGILLRLGILPKELKYKLGEKRHIWVHAVSVGEVNVVSALVEKLHRHFPGLPLVISTVTPAGNQLAKSIAGNNDPVIYLPLDLSFITEKMVRVVKPSLFITTETELWPNLISSLKRQKVPVVLINGRISLGSFRGYRLVRPFIRKILSSIKLFCMQSQSDAQKIIYLGADKNLVRVTGNMKFDLNLSASENSSPGIYSHLKSILGQANQLIIAGSTHKGEEEIIIRVYQKLLRQFGHLKLLIAPRHIERVFEVERAAKGFGFDTLRLSGLESAESAVSNRILILDVIGQLKRLYELATVVFVGGSLIKKGGHNIIEPALFGKPVIVGPYMFNFKDITRAFLENNAIIRVSDEVELSEEIRILLLSNSKREALGQRCQDTIKQNRGATEITFRLIQQAIGVV